jgi:hypothetical protein
LVVCSRFNYEYVPRGENELVPGSKLVSNQCPKNEFRLGIALKGRQLRGTASFFAG